MEEIYSWGSGAYGRLGHGSSNDVPHPQKVGGVCNGREFNGVSCGWYHSVCATNKGEAVAFGSSITGSLGLMGGPQVWVCKTVFRA